METQFLFYDDSAMSLVGSIDIKNGSQNDHSGTSKTTNNWTGDIVYRTDKVAFHLLLQNSDKYKICRALFKEERAKLLKVDVLYINTLTVHYGSSLKFIKIQCSALYCV